MIGVFISVLQISQAATPVATPANLIANSDFSNKEKPGFTSSYTYNADLFGEGTYFVGMDPLLEHGGAQGIRDHTNGKGKMMIVNGSTRPNVAVWQQTIKVEKGRKYDFSMWATSWGRAGETTFDPSPARLVVSVDGTLIHSPYLLLERSGQWGKLAATFTAKASKSVTIKIVDDNTDGYGNDFALDDISVVAQPVTDGASVKSN